MKLWQKIIFCILLAIHILIIYACVDGYYDTIMHNCASWGLSFDCPWGSDAMGVAWRDPYVYVSVLSQDFITSVVFIISAILATYNKNYKIAIWLLALPLLIGFCANILETQLSEPIIFIPSQIKCG